MLFQQEALTKLAGYHKEQAAQESSQVIEYRGSWKRRSDTRDLVMTNSIANQ
jgi:hypothetical protein